MRIPVDDAVRDLKHRVAGYVCCLFGLIFLMTIPTTAFVFWALIGSNASDYVIVPAASLSILIPLGTAVWIIDKMFCEWRMYGGVPLHREIERR